MSILDENQLIINLIFKEGKSVMSKKIVAPFLKPFAILSISTAISATTIVLDSNNYKSPKPEKTEQTTPSTDENNKTITTTESNINEPNIEKKKEQEKTKTTESENVTEQSEVDNKKETEETTPTSESTPDEIEQTVEEETEAIPEKNQTPPKGNQEGDGN